MGSDYVLCARGGDFSYRLYETLSYGRIPVFVDTDCVLPYDSEIKWKDYCVWVDEKEVNRIGERSRSFMKHCLIHSLWSSNGNAEGSGKAISALKVFSRTCTNIFNEGDYFQKAAHGIVAS